ncbi:HAD family hydrolase [Cylindrospermum sp. FACHB-282]|uniref:HAD family hydrolase n=1 Tax=Cylindrospermum sp. FACHB-282 TaxID=2692794 RepID=UPI001683A6BD|nr:HAD family hydrolase [Cylindrospermum sp. FACHB-282]MBD2384490.1 HAD family hydrolase [Cylindrospermum sp. FACHB-282]
MIKAVLFDLDGTLLDREESLQQFITAQYDRFSLQLSHIAKIDFITKFVQLLDCHGHVWKNQVYQSLVTEFDIHGLSWEDLLSDYETNFMFHCVPFAYLQETLILLQQQGYLLGIITNGFGTFQTRSIQGLDIQNYFDAILISEVEKIRKPQPEIFHRALNLLDVPPGAGVFIGDHPEADIFGAKRAGLKAIWKRNSVWTEPKDADAIINELNEIPSILKQLN